MANCLNGTQGRLKTFVGVAVSVGLLASTLSIESWAKTTNASSWPTRDFLPPLAVINPKLEAQQQANTTNDATVEAVNFVAVTSPVIHTSPKVDRIDSDLSSEIKTEQLQSILDIQQKVDTADLEHLWQAAVEKNPVIRFSLEKLATPADLQTKQSSRFLTKTLSTLISGATMASTMLPGGGAYRNMASVATGNALQNLMSGKTQPTPGSLSSTEQIQLAGLIDDLKLRIIRNYQDYKNTLQALAQSHEVTVKNNMLYSKALTSKNDLAVMASGTAYYQALMAETTLQQKAKRYRMELERLAGREAVSEMELAAQISDTTRTASQEPVAQPIATLSPPASSTTTPPKAVAMPLDIPEGTTGRGKDSEASASIATPPIGPQEPVGPEPPIETTHKTPKNNAKTAQKNKPVAMPIDLQQPMEIGPILSPESHVSVPLPQASRLGKQANHASKKAFAQPTESSLVPILEKMMEAHRPEEMRANEE